MRHILTEEETVTVLDFVRRKIEHSYRVHGPNQETKGIIKHIRSELTEIKKAPYDTEEWIDVILLAIDGAWRAGASPLTIVRTLLMKQKKNEDRKWPDWKKQNPKKPNFHIKEKKQ